MFPPTGRRGRYVKEHSLGKALRAAVASVNAERADGKVPEMKWYGATRHSFASRYVQAGGSLMKLAQILGHSTAEVTLRYAHLTPGNFTTRGAAGKLKRRRSARSWTWTWHRRRCSPCRRASDDEVLRRELRWSYKRREVGRCVASAGPPTWRNVWRRRQDSNLRALSGQRFSRPPPSASRPLLRGCDLARLRKSRRPWTDVDVSNS